MEKIIFFIILLLVFPFIVWYWIVSLKRIYVRKKIDREIENYENMYDEGNLDIFRDLFLAIFTCGIVLYFLLSLGLEFMEGFNMDAFLLIRIMLSGGVFLIVFGLSLSFLPEIFPYKPGSIMSNVLSWGTALLISGAFALYLGTTDSAYQTILSLITTEFLKVVISFLSVLFGAIGAYLIYRKVQSYIALKPSSLKSDNSKNNK